MSLLKQVGYTSNFAMLLGVHRLSAVEASELIGVSRATLSYWLQGHRDPSLSSLQKVAGFFEVDAMKLISQWPSEFLAEQIADKDRFERVERKIREPKVVPLKEGRS